MINKKPSFWFKLKKVLSELTKVLPSPDVHVGVILAQVVEPALVHDENSTSDDRSPTAEGGKKSFTLSNFSVSLEVLFVGTKLAGAEPSV